MTGARVDVRGVTWRPFGRRTPILDDVELTIEAGERVLLVGPSGSGKSTLLRAIAGVVDAVDPGDLAGEVLVDGVTTRAGDGRVGLLVQDPADARVAGTVGRDVAFGPENIGLARPEIHERVRDALNQVGFPYDIGHRTSALSGGEAQRLALAGVLAMRPPVLLLDEPTSMLDEESTGQVVEAVRRGVASLGGATLLVVEHRLGPWLDVVDRLIVMDGAGRLVADGPIETVLTDHAHALLELGIWVPNAPAPAALSIASEVVAPRWGGTMTSGAEAVTAERVGLVRREPLRLGVGRDRDRPRPALIDVSCQLRAGSVHALRGPSGAGKSSLIACLLGLERPTTGSVEFAAGLPARGERTPYRLSSPDLAARIGWVPQRAGHTVLGASVRESMLATCAVLGIDGSQRADQLIEILGLGQLTDRHPHQISGGELRRLAVATALVHGPAVCALDEPTVGQDRHTWAAVAGLIGAMGSAPVACVVSTHDDQLSFLVGTTTRLDRGRMVDVSPRGAVA